MKYNLIILFFFISFALLAQVPQGVGYQGVATDNNGIELVNQSISIKASVLSGSANGNVEWEETHATTTDAFGLFALTIGQGTSTGSGAQSSFEDISWGSNTHFLKIELDATGGNNYSFMGTNQMMSVPYALYAESANINYDSISNLLSVDSSFITNFGGGIGGGGCDLNYPDGLNGEIVDFYCSSDNNNTYVVPEGKRLYISRITGSGGLDIDGVEFFTGVGNYENPRPLISTIIADENQTLSLAEELGEIRFIGILVDASVLIDPISSSLSSNYTIPISKKLIITYVNRGNSSIQLNGNGLIQLSENNFTAFPIEGGGILDGSGSFNGYLVDENYFADCSVGGSSSSSSIASNVISNSIELPIPLNNINPLTIGLTYGEPYTVPDGKMFILSYKYPNWTLSNNNNVIFNYASEFISPLLFKSGDIIANESSNSHGINGFLIDEVSEVEPITLQLPYGQPYTVPDGKIFILTYKYPNWTFRCNSIDVLNYSAEFKSPLIFKSGDILENESGDIHNIHGYLVDEDYF